MRAADTVSPLVRCQIYRLAMGLDEIIEFAKANVAAIAVVIGAAIVLVALAERVMGRKIGLRLAANSRAVRIARSSLC